MYVEIPISTHAQHEHDMYMTNLILPGERPGVQTLVCQLFSLFLVLQTEVCTPGQGEDVI